MPTPWTSDEIHTVTVTHYVPAQDNDGGATDGYGTPYATDLSCYVENEASSRVLDAENRVIQVDEYTIFLDDNLGFVLNDKIVWIDALSVMHTMFIDGITDMTPQGGLCEVSAVERS